ncbi:histidine--tRNA ligase [Dictyobacter formicarum]|uniref:Histidine--tRNA ligase n=1 Tax=Dictyobacter formicarum TaxID=2778368 RepID=A0ABQ3VHS2_9CHLR|nr:histidine--tRNA ligase [Dictyobacter formicarum]GHO85739.1 histidine--tRNA ligase [Dictyobacter formicarum]
MTKVSGFVEWLPEQRIVELQWLDEIRRTFESYGFCSIETPSVEEIDALLAKGETDKEIYVIKRLQGEGDKSEARLGLHYDLTVPLARYVAEHYNDLVFPFKRYQIQRVWRGERPQEGRYREFYQCDIDVINNNTVPQHFDAEMPVIVYEIFKRLGVQNFQMHINNRKVLQGYFEGLGIEDTIPVLRIVDKLDKIGHDGVRVQLQEQLGMSEELAERCLAIGKICTSDLSFVERVRELGVQSELLDQGLEELQFVMNELRHVPEGVMLADLSIARGLDYYTGTVYEGKLADFPAFGTICSGGRYDDLTGSFISRKLPGVGISIGLTRLLAKLLAEQKLQIGPKSPTQVLVVFPSEERRAEAVQAARTLRERGLNVEMYPTPIKQAQQLRYASRKGIPYAWFLPYGEKGHEVKNMVTGQQQEVDLATWQPTEQSGVSEAEAR